MNEWWRSTVIADARRCQLGDEAQQERLLRQCQATSPVESQDWLAAAVVGALVLGLVWRAF